MAVVLPHGALFRMGSEGTIRRKVLEQDSLEAVIGLGSNLFYGASLAASILIFRQRKLRERQGKVLVIDASSLFKKGRNQNTLEPEHRDQIFELYRNFRDEPGLAKVVSLADIAANDYNLNIPRYVEQRATDEAVTVEQALTDLKQSLKEAYGAEDWLKALLIKSGLMEEKE
jgi:type I restriction enzyme M protein